MMKLRTDGKEAAFDTEARQIDGRGLSYEHFGEVMAGRPDLQDPCNRYIREFLAEGRSDAFCKEYRAGYDGAIKGSESLARAYERGAVPGSLAKRPQEVRAASRQLAERAGLARAEAAAEDERSFAQRHSPPAPHTAGLARATKLHGYYHEA